MTLPSHRKLAAARVLELFGPSSGGKSSLALRLLAGGGDVPVFIQAEARLLQRSGLGWLPEGPARVLALHLVALLGVLWTWPAARSYYAFSAVHALRGNFAASLWLRLNLLRNAWKAVALRLLASRFAAPGELLVLDEGPLQTANYLFVHVDSPPSTAALETFLRIVPLPDAAVYLRVDEDELVRRTCERGHARVPADSHDASARFVHHALAVFDRIATEPRVRRRLLPRAALEGHACAGHRVAS